MRTLIRYLLLFGLLVGLAFASVTVEVDGQTIFQRIRGGTLTEAWQAWSKPKLPAKRPSQTPPVERRRAAERVAILKKASVEASGRRRTPVKKKKTRVDPHISEADKKGLDDLLSSRIRGK